MFEFLADGYDADVLVIIGVGAILLVLMLILFEIECTTSMRCYRGDDGRLPD